MNIESVSALMKRAVRSMIVGYQRYISPMHPGCCRYSPTCSNYALEAIEKHGVLRGMLLALWRIIRCNPFSKGGYDPVPEQISTARHSFLRRK